IESRIELVGVDDVGERRIRRRIRRRRQEPALRRGQRVDRILADVLGKAELPRLEPVLVKVEEPERSADGSESMNIRIPDAPPVVELDAELEGAPGPPDEVGLVNLEQAVEIAQVRYRRLADADDADLLGFDQRHLEPRAEGFGERRSRHPSGAAPPYDDHRAKRLPPSPPAAFTLHP